MNRGKHSSRRTPLLAFVVLTLTAGISQGQGTPYTPYQGSYANSSYPYWASAPSSYSGGSMSGWGVGTSYGTSPGSIYSSPGYGLNQFGSSPLANYDSMSAPYFAPANPLLLPGQNYTPARDNSARLWLRVPADAEVWIDGDKTRQNGTRRHFVSPPLTPGKNYVYEVRVRWKRNGKTVEEKRSVPVRANANVDLDLTKSIQKDEG